MHNPKQEKHIIKSDMLKQRHHELNNLNSLKFIPANIVENYFNYLPQTMIINQSGIALNIH